MRRPVTIAFGALGEDYYDEYVDSSQWSGDAAQSGGASYVAPVATDVPLPGQTPSWQLPGQTASPAVPVQPGVTSYSYDVPATTGIDWSKVIAAAVPAVTAITGAAVGVNIPGLTPNLMPQVVPNASGLPGALNAAAILSAQQKIPQYPPVTASLLPGVSNPVLYGVVGVIGLLVVLAAARR